MSPGGLSRAAFVILALAGIFSLNATDGISILITLTALLMLLSARGARWNVAPGFLPKPVRVPVFNLAAILPVLFLLYVGVDGGGLKPPFCLFGLPPLLGLILLNVAVGPQIVDAQSRVRAAVPRWKAVPRLESWGFTAGAALLILSSAIGIVQVVTYDLGFSALLWRLRGLIAGVLLVNPEWREKGYLPAAVLLLFGPLQTIRAWNAAAGWGESSGLPMEFWLLTVLPIVLMLASAIGFSWNVTVQKLPEKLRVPVLNLMAAALAALQGISTVLDRCKPAVSEEVSSDVGAAVSSGLPVKAILLALIFPVGLVLVNLCLDSKTVTRKTKMPDGTEYKKGFAGLVQRFYSDVGGGLKALAKLQGVIFLVIGVLSAAVAVLGLAGFLASTVFNAYDLGTPSLR